MSKDRMEKNKTDKKENKNNLVWEFFRPSIWKIILIIVCVIIAYFFYGPHEMIILGNKITSYIDAPLGIKNPYFFIIVLVIFFYVLISAIEYIIKKIRK